jgi:acyl dehydratase
VSTLIYLDDLAVGRKFVTASATLTADDIKAFAAQFDPQAFHLDEQAAETSVFRSLAASGWHTGSLSMRLMVESDFKIAGGLIGLSGEVSWPRATYVGDTIHVEIEILDLRVSASKPDRGIITVRNTTLNQRGEPVQIGVFKMLVPRRPSEAT